MSEQAPYATYLVYYFAGGNVTHTKVTERTPSQVAKRAPADVYGFFYYDWPNNVPRTGGRPKLRRNVSVLYFIDAIELDQSAVFTLGNATLLDRMKLRGWSSVIRGRHGGFRAREQMVDGYQLISSS